MEKNWFECRVSYDKTMDNGAIKRIIEVYLVEAENFTEAEDRITRSMQPYISGDFTVSAVRRRTYEAVLEGEGDFYYRVKLIIITIDEKTAAEKKTNFFLLVQAPSFEQAVGKTQKSMQVTMADWYFHTVTETPILDVFKK